MPWTFASTLIVVVAAVLGFILGAVLLSRRNSRTSQIQAAVLRQDHEWFRTTLASISDGVLASNSDGKVTFLNAVAQALTGWTQEEARGKPLTEVFQIINEENRQTIESPTVRALREGAAIGLANHTLIARDGTQVCIDDRAAPIRDENGAVIGVVLVFRDGNERRRQSATLQQGADRFRFLAESMPQKIFTAAPNGDIDYFNQQWTEFTGLPFEQIRDWGWKQFMHPDDLDETVRTWVHALQSGEPYQQEHRFRRADGAYHWHLSRALPLRDDQGRIVLWIGSNTDVDDLKRAADALRLTRERFDLIQRSIDLGVWYCDLPLDKLNWNARCKEHFGLPPDAEVTLATFYERLHPDDCERTRETIERSLAEQDDYDVVYRTVAPNGRVRWIRAIGRPFCDDAGKPAHFDGVTVDVTEQIRHEEVLKDASRRKDEFLATLAHELRNPLAPIRNGLEVMRLAGNDGRSFAPIQTMLERQLGQLIRLVDDLLDLSRIDRGTIELRKERLDMAKVVEVALETSQPLIQEARHDLSVHLPQEPLWVTGDLTRLAQVVANLLNNSAKYTPTGGHLWLTVEQCDDWALVRVRDDGVGIAADMLPRIFEMFTQVERNLKQSQGGLGIGLTLVRRLVEMHNGTVEATSEGPGRGCEFIVTLPVAADLAATQSNGQTKEQSNTFAKESARRILVVDDNKDSAESLAMLLGMLGHEVRIAYDGPSALTTAKEFRPTAVLLDIGLPGMSGHEVARKLRQTPEGKDALLIAQTGWGQEEDRLRSREAGFDGHLVKPLDLAALRGVLAERETAPA